MPDAPTALPDQTFYRVSVKALVFDADRRLLVFMDKNHEWELPGGGWNTGESLENCLARELAEEVQVKVTGVGQVAFCYQGATLDGYPKVSIAASATLESMHFIPTGDNIAEAGFVTREEFLQLPFQPGEASIKDFVDIIWSA